MFVLLSSIYPLMIKYIYLILIMITPIVKSVNVKEYDFKQSKDE